MISRRDNLLVRPWQERRFENHRKKVRSAGPAIDNKPPMTREHVLLKLKKKQKEEERCEEINKNNFSLLKRLSYVMRTNRVDNYWTTPQPNFLNKVAMYDLIVPNFDQLYLDDEFVEDSGRPTSRKLKCLACNPNQQTQEVFIPEERMPWEPQKSMIGAQSRSKSVPPRKLKRETQKKLPKSAIPLKTRPKPKMPEIGQPDRIIVNRGCLKLSVNFPTDSLVKFQTGRHEKVLLSPCRCKFGTIKAN